MSALQFAKRAAWPAAGIGLLLAGLMAVGSRSAMTSVTAPDSFRFSKPSGWVEAESYRRMKTWTGDQTKQQFVSVVEDPTFTTVEVPPPDDADLVRSFKQGSALPHLIAGIQDYEITALKREVVKDKGYKISLLGHYKNAKGTLIRFEEWKYFLSTGYSQINFSELSDAGPLDLHEAERVLSRYEPFGI